MTQPQSSVRRFKRSSVPRGAIPRPSIAVTSIGADPRGGRERHVLIRCGQPQPRDLLPASPKLRLKTVAFSPVFRAFAWLGAAWRLAT